MSYPAAAIYIIFLGLHVVLPPGRMYATQIRQTEHTAAPFTLTGRSDPTRRRKIIDVMSEDIKHKGGRVEANLYDQNSLLMKHALMEISMDIFPLENSVLSVFKSSNTGGPESSLPIRADERVFFLFSIHNCTLYDTKNALISSCTTQK